MSASKSYHDRARALHERVCVVDAHCDTISLVLDDGLDLAHGDPRGQVDVPRLLSAGVGLQVLACWNEATYSGHAAFARCMAKIGAFHRLVRTEGLRPVTCPADLDVHGLGFVLSMEDAAPCMGSIPHLEALYAAGVRMIGLTWNGRNELADGVGVGARPGGLTDLGHALVAHMFTLGIVVDLAHVAEPSFWDVVAIAEKPLAVSHANAKAVCAHRRNLTDEQLKAIASTGGVVGVTYVPSFLTHSETHPGIADVIRHIDHMVAVMGIDHVGLGSDFDGIDAPPTELEHVGLTTNLTAALLEHGYSERDVEKIVSANWLRVFRANWRP